MKKQFIPAIFLAFAASALLGISACQNAENVTTDERDESTTMFNHSDFAKIDASGMGRIHFTQSDSYSVKAEGTPWLLEKLVIKQTGNKLVIYEKSHNNLRKADLDIYITAPSLEELELSGAVVFNTERLATDKFELDCGGASKANFGELKANDADLDASGAAVLKANVSAKHIDLDFSGAAKTMLSLSATTVDIDISGANSNVLRLDGGNVELDASGAAKITLQGAADYVNIEASGAATVNLEGNFANKSVKRSGAAKIATKAASASEPTYSSDETP